jgi:hypothetical protein
MTKTCRFLAGRPAVSRQEMNVLGNQISMIESLSRFVRAVPARMREEDKRKHVAWSFWLILAALVFMPAAQAFVLVFLIGLAKEFWDHFYGSGFCLFDMLGNALGIFLALSLALVVSGVAGLTLAPP